MTLDCSLKARPYRFYSLFLLLFLGILGTSSIARADIQNVPGASIGLGPQFAIADFDGDHIPDLASIQTGIGSSGITNYWLQVKFSTVERQSIQLVAPLGDLQIEAHDVNGDHAVDLVIASVSSGRPVAIFLNDGNGGFSRVEPSAFPGAFSESAASWRSESNQWRNAASIVLQSRTTSFSEACDLLHRQLTIGAISLRSRGFIVNSFLISHAGRAPPSELPNF